jgi:hypothetical protein
MPTFEQLAPFLRQQPGPMDTPCLVWTGKLDDEGYGVVYFRRGSDGLPMRRSVHRVAYRLVKGKLLPGMVLDHLCKVRNCAIHTEQITQAENVRRGDSPAGLNYRKDRCSRNHEPNWGTRPDGRYCRECLREDSRALRKRRKTSREAAAEMAIAA